MDSTVLLKKYFLNETNLIKEHIFFNVNLKEHCTFRIGGIAEIFVVPKSIYEAYNVFKLLKDNSPCYILGNGSNVLFQDGFLEGVVLDMSSVDDIIIHRNHKLWVSAGCNLSKILFETKRMEYTGLEFVVGIPGTVGGAVYMNAGAYGYAISDFVKRVIAIDKDGKWLCLEKKDIEFSYRYSIFQKKKCLILFVELELKKGIMGEIQKNIDSFKKRRKESQPLLLNNAGCIYKKTNNYYTGKIIEDCGLKGLRIGDAQISTKHAGFIVNLGDAKASDVIKLIKHTKKIIKEKYSVDLQLEIKLMGEFKEG